MGNPLGQGASPWARTTRFADLQWGMPRKKVLAMFATASSYPRHEGKNHVIVPETVALPSTPPPIPELPVHATVTFDADDALDSITLKSSSPRPADVTDAHLLGAANKVLAALGLDALGALPTKPAAWKHKATAIAFERDDDCFWIELSPAR